MNEMEQCRKAIDIIKKLLRLNRSSNPNEAALALQKAQEIAAKHRIDLSAVNPAEDEKIGRVGHEEFPMPSRISTERKYAMRVVINFFHVDAVVTRGGIGKSTVTFIGTPYDIEIAN